jgi:hypothetical protein
MRLYVLEIVEPGRSVARAKPTCAEVSDLGREPAGRAEPNRSGHGRPPVFLAFASQESPPPRHETLFFSLLLSLSWRYIGVGAFLRLASSQTWTCTQEASRIQ